MSSGKSTILINGFASDHESTVRLRINSGAIKGRSNTVLMVVRSMNEAANDMSPCARETIYWLGHSTNDDNFHFSISFALGFVSVIGRRRAAFQRLLHGPAVADDK